jgi:hypothetical protein
MNLVDPWRGYPLDESFIEQQHHTNPRRLYSVNATDWQYRVDHERLRNQRLARARAEMEADDLGALLLFAGANIRYVTGSYQGFLSPSPPETRGVPPPARRPRGHRGRGRGRTQARRP